METTESICWQCARLIRMYACTRCLGQRHSCPALAQAHTAKMLLILLLLPPLLPLAPEHGEHKVAHKLLAHVLDEDLLDAHLLRLGARRLQLLALRMSTHARQALSCGDSWTCRQPIGEVSPSIRVPSSPKTAAEHDDPGAQQLLRA